jgi:hypothetical protein
MSITREEHLQWCKTRALEILKEGDIPGAWTSFVSDMGKHDETRDHVAIELGHMLLLSGHNNTPGEMQKFIEGFN